MADLKLVETKDLVNEIFARCDAAVVLFSEKRSAVNDVVYMFGHGSNLLTYTLIRMAEMRMATTLMASMVIDMGEHKDGPGG